MTLTIMGPIAAVSIAAMIMCESPIFRRDRLSEAANNVEDIILAMVVH